MLDSYIFAFWAKTSIDVELRRIRLKSNSYTTNNILDTVTAATFQVGDVVLLFAGSWFSILLDFWVLEHAGYWKGAATKCAKCKCCSSLLES